jgi:hypothetical protein
MSGTADKMPKGELPSGYQYVGDIQYVEKQTPEVDLQFVAKFKATGKLYVKKNQVKEVWDTFSETDKKDIATTPGLWVCLRAQLQYGTWEEQEEIRENLKNQDVAAQNADSDSSSAEDNASGSESEAPMDMTTHWCMMQMNQMTFNTYMWSQGFNYSPVYGKMW